MKTKRIVSSLLTLVMMLSIFTGSLPVNATETNSEVQIKLDTIYAKPGTTVEYNVSIENNPGILGAILTLTYDNDLTLISAESGEVFSNLAMTKPGKLVSNGKFIWDGQDISEDEIFDGNILKLTFKVADKAKIEETLNVGVSYSYGDFVDKDLKPVKLNISAGGIRVLSYIPGDVNDDGSITTLDVVSIRRYLAGGYGTKIIEEAADVNGDGSITTTDIILIRRYIAGGYGVELKPAGTKCDHQMKAVDTKAATCTEDGNIKYWYCEKCGKNYSDEVGVTEISIDDTIIKAKGHTVVVDPYLAPTYTSEGHTEGSHCSVCGKVIKEYQTIPVLQKNEYEIIYDINNDYLDDIGLNNPNPLKYSKEEGLVLKDLKANGFRFLGWYTAAEGGTLVTEIPKGTAGAKAIYAQWKEIEYKITFDSPDVPVDSQKYKVSTGATLPKPSLGGYTFVGWSKDGKIVNSVPKGTVGNITLHANWTSDRNKAEAVSKLDRPEIIEDYDDGAILFIYEIGTIHNVPLSRIDVGDKEIAGPTDGLNLTQTYKYSTKVDESFAESTAKAISNATTRSSEWTLSEDWNSTTQATNEYEDGIAKTAIQVDEYGNVTGGKYYVSNSAGGSTSSTVSGGGSNALSAKVTQNDSVGINGSYTHEHEEGKSLELSAGFKQGMGGNGEAGTSIFGIDLKMGGSSHFDFEEGSKLTQHKNDKDSLTIATSREHSVGTEEVKNTEAHWNLSDSTTSNWNSEAGYEKSSTVSQNKSLSNSISETINKRWQYSSMESRGGSNSETKSTGETQELTDEYASTVEYSTETNEETEITQTIHRSETGYYRLINAGTAHVFAVVGYDIATNSYFTYTYNVLDKERHIFVDYSKNTALFNDCENAIIPFEIPIEVNEYISSIMLGTDGLSVDENGIISEKYTGDAEYIVIPQYMSIKNANNTYSAVRVRGITENVFQNNKNIKGVHLPKYVRSIPDNAFKGCTSLEIVEGYAITEIGNNAFDGCTSLNKFTIDEYFTSVGENAFSNVDELEVKAGNTNVADAVLNSGAKKISLDISKMQDTENNAFENKVLVIDNSVDVFHIMSNDKTYNNISIKSNAKETKVSNIRFANNTNNPLDIYSEKVSLSSVKVQNCTGFALMLHNDAEINLLGTVDLNSNNDYTAISKNVTLCKSDPIVTSVLKVNGTYLVCNQMNNQELFRGTLKTIDEAEYKAKINSVKVQFDANGGTFNNEPDSKYVYFGQSYGELPSSSEITKDYYNFEGWYTQASGGDKVTESTIFNGSSNVTLYAHWTQKPTTGWVLESNMPADAKVVDNKWTVSAQ